MRPLMNEEMDWNHLLGSILREFDCQTGTIHRLAEGEKMLKLVHQIGVPESLSGAISVIPMGKGIAGAAAERREPVLLCNLQQDLGGVAKPDARKTGVAGSVAVPILNGAGTEVLGTLGIGKFTPYDFSDAEIHRLEARAKEIGRIFEL